MQFRFVTCFGPGGWEKYAKRMVETAQEHWTHGFPVDVYCHDIPDSAFKELEPLVNKSTLALHSLHSFKPWVDFSKRWGKHDAKGDWRMDVAKFGNKVFAIQAACEEAQRRGDDYVIWLDADTFSKGPFSDEDLKQIVDSDGPDFYSLFREGTFIESSAMAFKVSKEGLGLPLAVAVAQTFLSGSFQGFREWHDGYVYSWMVDHFIVNHGMLIANWSQGVKGPGADAFNVSPWGKHMEHLKGNKKELRDIEGVLREELKRHYDVSRLLFSEETGEAVVLALLGQQATEATVDGLVFSQFKSQKQIEAIFDKVQEKHWKKIIMNLSDGRQAALLLKEHLQPPQIGQAEVKIQARDCVDQEVTFANIKENVELVKRELQAHCVHMEELVLASAGPSLVDFLDDIKAKQRAGMKVVCVKHSLPVLLQNGIMPWACVILDPRDIKDKSTHGVQRESLFDEVPKQVKFMIASITHPSVTKTLLAKGADMYLWHAYSQNSKEYPWPQGTRLITGGTCAALRSISLFHAMGWRTFHLYGMDFSYEGLSEETIATARDEDGRLKYYKVTTKGSQNKKFISTGELMAGAQDLERLAQNFDLDFSLHMYGSGLAQQMFREAGWKNRKHYSEFFNVQI